MRLRGGGTDIWGSQIENESVMSKASPLPTVLYMRTKLSPSERYKEPQGHCPPCIVDQTGPKSYGHYLDAKSETQGDEMRVQWYWLQRSRYTVLKGKLIGQSVRSLEA